MTFGDLGLVLSHTVGQWEAPLPEPCLKLAASPTLPYTHGLILVPWLLGVGGRGCRSRIISPCTHILSPVLPDFTIGCGIKQVADWEGFVIYLREEANSTFPEAISALNAM